MFKTESIQAKKDLAIACGRSEGLVRTERQGRLERLKSMTAGMRRRGGFTLIEMLVVVAIILILMTLIIGTLVNALSEMQAAGGASGVAGFLRDAQVKAVQSGKVLGVRADKVFPGTGQPFWRLTAWEFPTNADALLRTARGDAGNADHWPQGTLAAATFDLDARQTLKISDSPITLTDPENPALPAILLMPDGTANRDVALEVADAGQAAEGVNDGTTVELRHSTGRVYLYSNRFASNP